MVGLKASVDSLDGLDEAVAGLYVERDGAFVLDVEPSGGLELDNVKALKTALGRERESVRKMKADLALWSDIEGGPDAARQAIDRLAELGDDPQPDEKAKAAAKAREEALIRKHQEEIVKRDKTLGHLTSQLKRHLVEGTATQAIAAEKGVVELLLPHVVRRLDMRQDDNGDFQAVVLDEHGNPAVGDGSGGSMTIQGLVQEFKHNPTYGRAFDGSGQSGGGTNTQDRGDTGTGVITLTRAQAKDVRVYRAARERAAKEGRELRIAE